MSDTYFVVRDTDHPAEDLARNWSAPLGGIFTGVEWGEGWATEQDAKDAEEAMTGEVKSTYRYHPAYDCFVMVDFEGLGAFCLEAENVNDAIIEANEMSEDNDLANCEGSGDGHFYAKDVVSFYKVRDGRYVFEINC